MMRKIIVFLYLIFTASLIKANQIQVFGSNEADIVINYFESNQIDELMLHYWQSDEHWNRRFVTHVKNVTLRKAEKVGTINRYEIELTGITSNGQTLQQNIDLATVYIKLKGNATHLCELLRFDCEQEESTPNLDWDFWIMIAKSNEREFLEEQKEKDSIKKQEQIKQESRIQREKEKNGLVMKLVSIGVLGIVFFVFNWFRKKKKVVELEESKRKEELQKREAEAIKKKEDDIRNAKYLEEKTKQEEIQHAAELAKEKQSEEESVRQEQERLAKELIHKKQWEEERKKQEEERIAKELVHKKQLEEERIRQEEQRVAKELAHKKELEENRRRQEEERIAKELAHKKNLEEERIRLEEERNNKGYFIEVEENSAFVIKGPFTPDEIKSKLENGEIVLTTMVKKGIKTIKLKPLHAFSEFNAGLDGFL